MEITCDIKSFQILMKILFNLYSRNVKRIYFIYASEALGIIKVF